MSHRRAGRLGPVSAPTSCTAPFAAPAPSKTPFETQLITPIVPHSLLQLRIMTCMLAVGMLDVVQMSCLLCWALATESQDSHTTLCLLSSKLTQSSRRLPAASEGYDHANLGQVVIGDATCNPHVPPLAVLASMSSASPFAACRWQCAGGSPALAVLYPGLLATWLE